MDTGFDPISILLIDDTPTYLGDGDAHAPRDKFGDTIPFPSLGKAHVDEEDDGEEDSTAAVICRCFRMRWVASAVEARELRNLTLAISLRSPHALAAEGWLPEIVCFDYSMSRDERPVTQRGLTPEHESELSPLPALRECARHLGLPEAPKGVPPTLVETGSLLQGDNYGCYAGGLIVNLLSGHPCAPVPHTVKENVDGSEVRFFEWMLEDEFHKAFDKKGNRGTSWRLLLAHGVSSLRERIKTLARAGVIRVSLSSITDLVTAKDTRGFAVEIGSRFGTRRYPADGLFLDSAREDRADAARQWGEQMLRAILVDLEEESFVSTKEELLAGKLVAEELWKAYLDDDRVEQRACLSRLWKDYVPGTPRGTELDALATRFGVSRDGKECTSTECIDLASIEIDTRKSDAVKRWAVLFVTTQLLKLESSAGGVVGARDSRVGGLLESVTEEDLYLALFPVATKPVALFFHKKGTLSSSAWLKMLQGLGQKVPGRQHGTLGLTPSHLLGGRDWSKNPRCRWTANVRLTSLVDVPVSDIAAKARAMHVRLTIPEGVGPSFPRGDWVLLTADFDAELSVCAKVRNDLRRLFLDGGFMKAEVDEPNTDDPRETYGVLPHERYVMQAYAQSIGYPRESWSDQASRVFQPRQS